MVDSVQVIPYFFVLIGLEIVVRWFQDKPLPRVNDSISSLTAGIFLQFGRVIVGAFEISSYVWLYNNCRLYALPWDSAITWWIALLAYDFFYYWFHRMAHGKGACPKHREGSRFIFTAPSLNFEPQVIIWSSFQSVWYNVLKDRGRSCCNLRVIAWLITQAP